MLKPGPGLKNPRTKIRPIIEKIEEAEKQLDTIQQAFKDRVKEEARRIEDVTDSEYWVALCFETRRQKEEFLSKSGAAVLGDKYVNGADFAKRIGIKLESIAAKFGRVKKTSERLLGMVG